MDKMGVYGAAAASYERAAALEPRVAKTHNNRGVALARLARYDAALAAYDRAVALQPGEPRFYYNRACAYARTGRKEEMRADLGRAFALDGSLRDAARDDEDFAPWRGEPAFERLVRPEGAGT